MKLTNLDEQPQINNLIKWIWHCPHFDNIYFIYDPLCTTLSNKMHIKYSKSRTELLRRSALEEGDDGNMKPQQGLDIWMDSPVADGTIFLNSLMQSMSATKP